MATVEELYAERKVLRKKISALKVKIQPLALKIDQINDQIARLTYPCSCVKLNQELDIYDMSQQEAAGRNGLGSGFVSECLSADKNCPICRGAGIPKKYVRETD